MILKNKLIAFGTSKDVQLIASKLGERLDLNAILPTPIELMFRPADMRKWRQTNWGTSNVVSHQFDSSDRRATWFFASEWSTPVQSALILSRQHPGIMLRLDYMLDEQDGFTGTYLIKNGNIVSESYSENIEELDLATARIG